MAWTQLERNREYRARKRARERAAARPPEPLWATCWCEATFVKVMPVDVLNGRTGSCGVPGCDVSVAVPAWR